MIAFIFYIFSYCYRTVKPHDTKAGGVETLIIPSTTDEVKNKVNTFLKAIL